MPGCGQTRARPAGGAGALTAQNRSVAGALEMRHRNLLRRCRAYVYLLREGRFWPPPVKGGRDVLQRKSEANRMGSEKLHAL